MDLVLAIQIVIAIATAAMMILWFVLMKITQNLIKETKADIDEMVDRMSD